MEAARLRSCAQPFDFQESSALYSGKTCSKGKKCLRQNVLREKKIYYVEKNLSSPVSEK